MLESLALIALGAGLVILILFGLFIWAINDAWRN